jgi:YihY family inner membrane protein
MTPSDSHRVPEVDIAARLDRWQRRHPSLSFPIAVVYKYVDDQGTYLAALITYYGFLSLFPLLLLFASILGFVLEGNPDLQRNILDSTLSQFPIIGDQLRQPESLEGNAFAVAVGALVALYGTLGVAQATQNAMNVAWRVPRHRRPNPIKARLRSLLLLAIGGTAVLATTCLSALVTSAGSFGADVSQFTAGVATAVAIAINAAVFLIGFRVSTARKLSARDAAPGAVIAAVAWQALQFGGAAYFGHVFKDSSPTYGVFSLVLGMIGWIFLAAVAIVAAAEVNVVRVERLYPRALLTPFTDDVDLTTADQVAYTDAAVAQRAKDFQLIDVTFENEGQNASANRKQENDRAQ